MDASPVACSSSNGEATTLPLSSSSSLPPTHHYLPTSPSPSRSLNLESRRRRQSLKSESSSSTTACTEAGANGCVASGDVDLTNTSRSTSSPQLMSVKSRSKVYRRASLKSLTNVNLTLSPSHSRIIKVSSRGKNEPRPLSVIIGDQQKENKPACDLLQSSPYPYSTPRPCQTGRKESESRSETREDEKQQQQPKSRSCGSFLPILSLIPHTVISFQYPSPKMKFSWWRNKIS